MPSPSSSPSRNRGECLPQQYHYPQGLPFPLLVSSLLGIAGCGLPGLPPASPAIVSAVGTRPEVQVSLRDTVGTARELWPTAQQEALAWHPEARLWQLDAAHISANGLNDHPFDATWTFTFSFPENPVTVLKVIFDSGQVEPLVREVGGSGAYSDRPVEPELWRIDSPEALQVANRNGIVWFPVDRMRLSFFSDRLAWQVRSAGDYVAMDATTGRVFRPSTTASRLALAGR